MATRFLIDGRVQGVGYRDWCRRQALERGLRGYVRNLSDGRVEAVVMGPSERVDDMLAACRVGPPAASVTAVGLDVVDDTQIDGFVILKNA